MTPQQLAQHAKQHPTEVGAGLLLAGLLLKTAVVVKILCYACLTFGLIFLWEAFRAETNTPTS